MRPAAGYFPDLCSVFSLLVLMLLAILGALVITLLRSGLPGFDWSGFALALLFTCWTTLICAALLCQLSNWLGSLPIAIATGLAMALVVAVVSGVTIAAGWWSQGAFYGTGDWQIDGYAMAENALIASIIGGVALRYAAVNRALRLQQQSELTARLEALQARIKPHFLFNSLNNIASLIDHAPATAEQAVLDLAALFRAGLARHQTLVSWRQEKNLCEQYLRIEQLRLGERLRVEWSTAAMDDDFRLPALSVQPLLENAIVHGIALVAAPGVLRITAHRQAGKLMLEVSNPLPPASAAAEHDGNNMAVENIRHRLLACYGAAASLELTKEAGCFVARLSLPQEQPA